MPSLATSNAGAQFESYRHACADQLRDLLGAPGNLLVDGAALRHAAACGCKSGILACHHSITPRVSSSIPSSTCQLSDPFGAHTHHLCVHVCRLSMAGMGAGRMGSPHAGSSPTSRTASLRQSLDGSVPLQSRLSRSSTLGGNDGSQTARESAARQVCAVRPAADLGPCRFTVHTVALHASTPTQGKLPLIWQDLEVPRLFANCSPE